MKKIDIHTHILPPEIPPFKEKFGYGGFMKMNHLDSCRCHMLKDDGSFFREIERNCFDAQIRLEECDSLGVTTQVLSTVPVMFSYWSKPQDGLLVSRFLNDHLAAVVEEHPERFIGLGTVPLQDPDLACVELERCMKELGFAGVQVGTNINGNTLDENMFSDFFKTAESLGASVFVHPWDMAGLDRMPRYFLPWLVGMPLETTLTIASLIFSGFYDRHPKLRMAFAHGGGALPYLLGRLQKGYESRPDICAIHTEKKPVEYLKRIFVDSLVHDVNALKYLVDTLGVDNVMLGTDYPFPLRESSPGSYIKETFDPEAQDKLLFKNALNWLNRGGC